MNRKQIILLLQELVKKIDYDAYRGMFVPECIEEPEFNKEQIEELIKIVRKYIK